jgi:hypothetical protein
MEYQTRNAERRKCLRYAFAAPVKLLWKSSDHSWKTCTGVTHDISTEGMFVFADECPAPAFVVRAHVQLLIEDIPVQSQPVLTTAAEVVRVMKHADGQRADRFALQFRRLIPVELTVADVKWRHLLARHGQGLR